MNQIDSLSGPFIHGGNFVNCFNGGLVHDPGVLEINDHFVRVALYIEFAQEEGGGGEEERTVYLVMLYALFIYHFAGANAQGVFPCKDNRRDDHAAK